MVSWDVVSGIQKEVSELCVELKELRNDIRRISDENVEMKRIIKILYERLVQKNESK